MASTSAPRARSSASRVDCARPSPENVISARHAAGAPSPPSWPPAARAPPSPAQGVAAVGPPVCRLRALCVVSSPARTRAANVPPPTRSSASSWARPRP
eukprot:3170340-Pleurochrysis_carterae.AAC.1